MKRSYLFRTGLCGLLLLLMFSLSVSSFAASAGPTLSVNAAAGQKPISPYIYGINFADPTLAAELHFPVDRYGGNATTRYNWQNDTANHASDWYFENISNGNPNPGGLPNGSASDLFVDQDRSTGSKTIMTIPLIGWTPKDNVKRCGFSVAKYGAQQSTDPWMPDCGNGKHTDGTNITGNDPTDTSVAIGPSFVQGWVQHLMSRYGTAANGGVLFYDYDNEPDLWCDTHRDVHPNGATYDEMKASTYAYGAALKATDPGAKTLGPVGWGFNSLLYSGGDQCAPGSWWVNPPDRTAHGGVPFGDWYLQQMAAYEKQHGVRILDYYDNHFYPQGANVSLTNAVDSATAALRLRSTRSLWDPTYTDESWIAQVIQLIPRLHNMINADYPGTKTAITEYNWGALNNINGALVQGDVLGIFGREGLDLAALWSGPAATDPGAYAFRMYLNYDGAGGHFGDTSVSANSTNQDQLAIYASTRSSDGALLLMIINKDPSNDLTSAVSLSGFSPAAVAKVYRYSQANLGGIVHLSDQAVTSTGFSTTFPAYSMTLFVIPHATGLKSPTPSTVPSKTNTPTSTLSKTNTPSVTPSNTVIPATNTPTNTATLTKTSIPATNTSMPTKTTLPTSTPTNTATPTYTLIPATNTAIPTKTNVPTNTPTNTASSTNTVIPSSNTPIPTKTNVPTITPTNTATSTHTPIPATNTPVPTKTALPTSTHTNTATSTHTPIPATNTPFSTKTTIPTGTPSKTNTPVPSKTATPTNTPSLSGIIVDDAASGWHWYNWHLYRKSSLYKGTGHGNNNIVGGGMYIFDGIGVDVYTWTGPNGGKVHLFIDGKLIGTYSEYSAAPKYQQLLASVSGLKSGKHTLMIFSAYSWRKWTMVDFLKITPGSGATLTPTFVPAINHSH